MSAVALPGLAQAIKTPRPGACRDSLRAPRSSQAWRGWRPRLGRRRGEELRAAAAAPSAEGPPGPVDSGALKGFTPYYYVSYATERASEARASVVVGAPAAACFESWFDRENHFQFLTLAEDIGFDVKESTTAMYHLLYRWGELPTLQMACEVERTEVVPGELIRFKNRADPEMESELPLNGEVRFEAAGKGSARVTLRLSYAMPNLLKDEVGAAGVEASVQDLMQDNLERFKAFVESA